jgi:hypothetical protein
MAFNDQIKSRFVLLIFAIVLFCAGCGPSSLPQVSEIRPQPDDHLLPHETITLSIEASGTDLKFKWTPTKGTIIGEGSSVIYTAPDTQGPDPISVEVTSPGGSVVKNKTIQVVAFTLTPTATNAPTHTPTFTPEPTHTPTHTPTFTPTSTSTSTSTPLPPPTPSSCPSADAEGTIPPAVAISSVTFEVNGVEQVVTDTTGLTASVGDQLRVSRVAICPTEPFEGSSGIVYVEFDPVDKSGQVIPSAVTGTIAVSVEPDLTTILGPPGTWTIDNEWRQISVATVHYPPGGGTQNVDCENSGCEIDDRLIISVP